MRGFQSSSVLHKSRYKWISIGTTVTVKIENDTACCVTLLVALSKVESVTWIAYVVGVLFIGAYMLFHVTSPLIHLTLEFNLLISLDNWIYSEVHVEKTLQSAPQHTNAKSRVQSPLMVASSLLTKDNINARRYTICTSTISFLRLLFDLVIDAFPDVRLRPWVFVAAMDLCASKRADSESCLVSRAHFG
jgi:hypothetical protein